jgi:hypothetical protein
MKQYTAGQSENMKPIKRTNNVYFDEHLKTFRLHAGNTLYAFCISPELTLEHLYWGKMLHEGYDLRFFSQSCRTNQVFTTVEAPPFTFDGKIVSKAETIEEVQKIWRENKMWKSSSNTEDKDYVQKKRLENYSWRVMSKISQSHDPEDTVGHDTYRGRRRSFNSTYHPDTNKENVDHNHPMHMSRRRTLSHDLGSYKVDPHLSFQDLKCLATLAEEKKQTEPSRYLESIAKDAGEYKSRQTFERQLGKLGKGGLCVEYSDHGTGDFRPPSFIVIDNYNGSAISPLRYRSHKIYKGKLPLEGMPSIRCLDTNEASTLVVTMMDIFTGLEVDLVYGMPFFFFYSSSLLFAFFSCNA